MSESTPTKTRPDPAPRRDPRLRARRVGVARSAGRRRLYVALSVLGVAVVVVGALSLLHSGVFSAKHITVLGAVHTSSSAILSASGLSADPPLIDVNAGADDQSIEALPWIASAAVTVSWPDSVTVRVTERVPVAVVPTRTHHVALLDATGRVITDVARRPPGLVTLDLGGRAPAVAASLPASEQPLIAVIDAMPRSLVTSVGLVRQTRSSGIELVMKNGPVAIIGTATDLTQKFVSLATVLARVSVSPIVTIDLRVPAAPVLTK